MTNNLSKEKCLFIAACTSLAWGATGVFIRFLPALSPFSIAAGRLLFAFLFLLPTFLFSSRVRHSFIEVITEPIAYFLALLMIGYYLLATTAFQLSSVAELALLLSITPIYVMMFSFISGKKPCFLEVLGGGVAISGLVIVLQPNAMLMVNSSNQLFGNILAMIAAALVGLYSFIYRSLSQKKSSPDSIGVSALTFFLGSIVLLIFTLNERDYGNLSSLDGKQILVLVMLGVFSTSFPSIGFAIVSRELPPLISACVSLMIPLFASAMAFVILTEVPSLWFIPGGTLVLVGVGIILRYQSS